MDRSSPSASETVSPGCGAPASSRARDACSGFTLLELMITITVAAILVMIAVPSYRSITQRNTAAASVNDLVGALNYARSLAVTRNSDVYVCATTDRQNCSKTNNWSQGWIIYAPTSSANTEPTPNTIVQVDRPSGTGVVFQSQADGAIKFNSSGFAMTGRTFRADTGAGQTARITCVVVAATGRVRTDTTAGCAS